MEGLKLRQYERSGGSKATEYRTLRHYDNFVDHDVVCATCGEEDPMIVEETNDVVTRRKLRCTKCGMSGTMIEKERGIEFEGAMRRA